MNDLPTLDDLERDIVRALSAKAGQLDVDDAPFRTDAVPLRGSADVTPLTRRHGRSARRLLAAAAALALVATGATLVQRQGTDEADLAAAPIVWAGMPAEGTAAFVPSAVPDGWTLGSIGAGSRLQNAPETWQLFAADGPSPLARGVLVSTGQDQHRALGGDATHAVQGGPARVRATDHPLVPSEAFEMEWADGDLFHDVIAVGMSEAEVLDFLESLVPDDDPAAGFHAPPGSALPQLDVATNDGEAYYAPYLRYASPSGDQAVTVYTTQPGYTGGLIYRLAGSAEGDDLVIRGAGTNPFVSLLTADGWGVEAVAEQGFQDPAGLDAVVASAEPATRQQVVDLVSAEPVTATETVGDWTVEERGNGATALALCLTPAGGEATCTTAQTLTDDRTLTTGSALVDGEWVVVVITLGDEPAQVETATVGPEGVAEEMPETLEGERIDAGDRMVEIVTVPDGVEAVSATVEYGGGEDQVKTGLGYTRPEG
jgi:hypothetical protein